MLQKIEKILITDGIYLISIPKIDLQILCGSPADIVKHLAQKGFIISIEKNGVAYQTGPNAILLSDINVQNGSISNLCEFPILQMLYKQGMLIPNHPNNNGTKPILIGSKQQVESQIQYIYRGNYGLVSEEEIQETGISKDKAKEMMRMKLKFAFGQIKDTHELIQSVIVEDNKTAKIKDGATIKREALNEFTISYKDESVKINLTLKENQTYSSPYNLGFYDIHREYFAIIHSGQGDGWDIHRPSMSSILMYQGKIYLIDAGPNIQNILQSLGIGLNEICGIFHTHTHDDHFAGITSLLQTDHNIKYYATPLVRATVAKKLSALLGIDEEQFENYFDVHDLEFDKWNDIEGLEVKPIFSPHPIETNLFIFRTIWNEGYQTYAHFADIASFSVLEDMVTEDKNAFGISKEFFEQTKKEYLQKVLLKKIDIGGGMIHGDAKDFVKDESSKIVLAHTSSSKLTQTQKSIGSGAPFGAVDILIPDRQDVLRRNVYYHLMSHFPSLLKDQTKILMNCEIKTFNPESILLREYKPNDAVYLILTGNVEMIEFETSESKMIPAGAFIGDINVLLNIPLHKTYRAISYVKALEIPTKLFTSFIEKNNLHEVIGERITKFEILNDFKLFSDFLSFPIQNKIAKSLQFCHYEQGDKIIKEDDEVFLYLIITGTVQRIKGDTKLNIIKRNDFFGEEQMMPNKKGSFQYIAIQPVTLYKVPHATIEHIPIISWKLFEAYQKI